MAGVTAGKQGPQYQQEQEVWQEVRGNGRWEEKNRLSLRNCLSLRKNGKSAETEEMRAETKENLRIASLLEEVSAEMKKNAALAITTPMKDASRQNDGGINSQNMAAYRLQ